MSEIGRFFGVSEDTIRRHAQELFHEGRAKAKETIARTAFQMAKGGDKVMVMFWLKCMGGWSEKSIVENVGGQATAPSVLKVVFEEAPPSTRKPNAKTGDPAED